MIVVTLKEHLAQLKRKEFIKPEGNRKHVPNFSELAQMASLSFKTISKVANNHSKSFNRRTLGLIIIALREAGFSTKLSDILTFQEGESKND